MNCMNKFDCNLLLQEIFVNLCPTLPTTVTDVQLIEPRQKQLSV